MESSARGKLDRVTAIAMTMLEQLITIDPARVPVRRVIAARHAG